MGIFGLFGPSLIKVKFKNHTPDTMWVTIKTHVTGVKTIGSSKPFKLDTGGIEKWERLADKSYPIYFMV